MSVDVSDARIATAYDELRSGQGVNDWFSLGYEGGSARDKLALIESGQQGLDELKSKVSTNEPHFGLLRVEGRLLLWTLLPEGIGGVRRARALVHSRALGGVFRAHHATLTVSRLDDITFHAVRSKLRLDGSGSIPNSPNPALNNGTFQPPSQPHSRRASATPAEVLPDSPPAVIEKQRTPNSSLPPPISTSSVLPNAPVSRQASLARPSARAVSPSADLIIAPQSHPRSRTTSPTPRLSNEALKAPSNGHSSPSTPRDPAGPSQVEIDAEAREASLRAEHEAAARAEAERAALAAAEQAETDRVLREEAERREAAERLKREEARRAEQAEREARDREMAERKERERQERLENERRERERIETARREKEERAAAARRAQEEAKARAYDSLRQRHETLRTTPDAVLLNGHVNVQGGGSIMWRRRWFELRSAGLLLYKSQSDTASPLSTISLQGVKAIVEAPEEIFIPHSFAIRFADFDVEPYYLYADEQDDKELLMNALKMVAGVR